MVFFGRPNKPPWLQSLQRGSPPPQQDTPCQQMLLGPWPSEVHDPTNRVAAVALHQVREPGGCCKNGVCWLLALATPFFFKVRSAVPTSAAYNRHPELGVWQTSWVVKRAWGGPGRGGGGWEMACPRGCFAPRRGHGPAGDARDAVNKSRELCDAIIMVARPCIELPIVSISAETDGGLLENCRTLDQKSTKLATAIQP